MTVSYFTPPAVASGAGLSLQIAPAGALGETIDGRKCYSDSGALASGTLYCFAMPLPSGALVSSLTFVMGNTAEVGGTHGAYMLLDKTRKVVAVSADQTTNAFAPLNTPLTLPMGAPFQTTYTGLYYACVYAVATTPPSFAGANTILAGVSAIPPVLSGTSNAGLTTPPALGTIMNALTPFNGSMYAYAS